MRLTKIQKKYCIPVSEPSIASEETRNVLECLKSNWISSQGKYIKKFENLFKIYTKSKYALVVSNGTVAIELALKALRLEINDEVIVPNLTFAATINSVINAGGKPVLVDVEKDTWNMKISDVIKKISKKTKFIIPVHLYGNPVDMIKLKKICNKKKIQIIEDCAEALGSKIGNKHVGNFGEIGTFSFYGNKLITTGEGGMLIFKNRSTYLRAKLIRDHGMSITKKYYHSEVGSNFRMTNIQAAIGCAQMQKIDKFLLKRKRIHKIYYETLKSNRLFIFQKIKKNFESSFWLFTILIKNKKKKITLTEKLRKLGIDTRPLFTPLSKMKVYKKYTKNFEEKFDNSEHVSSQGISFPSSVNLTQAEVYLICKLIKRNL